MTTNAVSLKPCVQPSSVSAFGAYEHAGTDLFCLSFHAWMSVADMIRLRDALNATIEYRQAKEAA